MAKISITMNIPQLEDIKRLSLKKFIAAQNTLTAECKKAADVYTPMQSGNLRNAFEYDKNAETGAYEGWTYLMPYARRNWHGITKAGKPFNFSTDANPQAQSRWTEKATVEHRARIMAAVIRAAQNG